SGVSGPIPGGISRTVETFVVGGRFRRRISSRIVTTPTSFLRSMTGSSWMSFDFILPRPSPSVSSGLAVTRSVDMKSDTRRSWTLFRFMKNPLRGESDSGLAYKKSAAIGSRNRRTQSQETWREDLERRPRLRLAGFDDEAALGERDAIRGREPALVSAEGVYTSPVVIRTCARSRRATEQIPEIARSRGAPAA